MTAMLTVQNEIENANAQIVSRVNGRAVTRGELKTAFERVESSNWKDPINCTLALTAADRAMIAEAVVFFTGSRPTFALTRKGRPSTYRVEAAGYYATCGA